MLKEEKLDDLSASNIITVKGDKVFFGHLLPVGHEVNLEFVKELHRPLKTVPKRNVKKAVLATFKGTSPSK